MKVAVVGAGYVGLSTSVALAWVGHTVQVVEADDRKLHKLKQGHAPFYEPSLQEAMSGCADRLTFTPNHATALDHARVVFIAVGTPPASNGAPDVSQLHVAFHQVLASLSPEGPGPVLLVNKSTVPIGTGDHMARELQATCTPQRVSLISNPEFLRQGRALADSLYPDRIVLGGDAQGIDTMRELYAPIINRTFQPPPGVHPPAPRPVPVHEVDRRSAELAKYSANAFLALRVSFINEIANLCDRLGADVDSVAAIMGADPRIGRHFLHAGLGYGGSCFPKDTRALQNFASEGGYRFEILEALMRVNDSQRLRIVEKLEAALGDLGGKRIALLGLAFKPGTDDIRGAPSIPLISDLATRGALVRAHDPRAIERVRNLVSPTIEFFSVAKAALSGADAAVLVTEWPEYLSLRPEDFRRVMRRALIIDGRNACGREIRQELEYYGIGRPSNEPRPADYHAVAAD